ncbi:DUF6090 family protein [Ekhidna sp.]|uniref:DUF6090 family protein n=1 Tax=Ekhidna sp. TaxID=2608089 RepID=UPI003C7E4DBE
MLTFLREVRRKLISKNKVTSYLLYAIGEIFLVVIGILIAVSIDDWNQYQNERETEQKIVLEIKKDLETSRAELKEIIDFQIECIELTKVLYDQILNGSCDSVTVFAFMLGSHEKQFYPKTSGYEALKSEGLNIIINDTLRRAITDIYELGFPKVVKRGLFENNIDNPMQMTKVITERHFEFRGSDFTVPVNDSISYKQKFPVIANCSKFINDPQVISLAIQLLAARNEFIYYFGAVEKEIGRVIETIDKTYLND